jgi:hypothetical protein
MSDISTIPIHPSWSTNLDSEGFMGELCQTLDATLGVECFSNSRRSKRNFFIELAKHGMDGAVPADVREDIMREPSVVDAVCRDRLTKIAAGDQDELDRRRMVAAVLSMSRGLKTVIYTYYGGTDEVDPSEDITFDAEDSHTKKIGWEIWSGACAAAQMAEDELFWSHNSDSGAGDGSTYTCTLTIELLTMTSHQGEEVWDDSGIDGFSNDAFSDEGPEEDIYP